MRFGLKTMITVLLAAATVAALYAEREKRRREDEAYRTLASMFERGVPFYYDRADEAAVFWRRLLETERGLEYVRRLDASSNVVAFDERTREVYFVSQSWPWKITPPDLKCVTGVRDGAPCRTSMFVARDGATELTPANAERMLRDGDAARR